MNKDFDQIFKPIYFLTTLCGAKKIRLKKHTFSLTNKTDIFISVLAYTVLVTLYFMTFQEFATDSISPLMYNMYISTYFLYVMHIAILRITNVVHKKNNLNLFLTLRKIYKQLSLRKELKKIKLRLIIPCTIYFCGYSLFVVCKVWMDPLWFWARGFFIFFTIMFDLELIYSSFIVYFLSIKFRKLAKVLKNVNDSIDNYEEVLREIYKAFHLMIDAVIFNKKVFQISVIIFMYQ